MNVASVHFGATLEPRSTTRECPLGSFFNVVGGTSKLRSERISALSSGGASIATAVPRVPDFSAEKRPAQVPALGLGSRPRTLPASACQPAAIWISERRSPSLDTYLANFRH